MQEIDIQTQQDQEGERLDKFLFSELGEISRSYIQKLIDTEKVLINGSKTNKKYKVMPGDQIKVLIPDPKPIDVLPEKIDLNIIYEDSDLLVVNKPKNMVVHPAAGNYTGTLVNALLYHCKDSLSGINGFLRPGIVHRIDKDTSGLLIVAKNDVSHQFLSEQIKSHSFTREYEAVVYGNIKNDTETIKGNIGRHKSDRKKMAVVIGSGKPAVTHYEVLKRYGNYTHLKLKLETGRTHQIRVHLSHIGHPVVGDEVYANPKNNPFKSFLKGQCLHARKIGFIHPSTKKYLKFTSDLPTYFQKVLENISN